MKYTFSKIRENVFLVESETQYELTSMFVRPQEFYESPFENIKGKHFSLDEFMDTYAKEMGNFTYFSDWSGFNITGGMFKAFFQTFRFDLREKERILLQGINGLCPNLDGQFYVLGAIKGKLKVINHEIAHAYWYLYPKYKYKMIELSQKNISTSLYDDAFYSLTSKGYDSSFVDDELQAYLATTPRDKLLKILGWNKHPNVRVPSSFRKFFKEFDLSHK